MNFGNSLEQYSQQVHSGSQRTAEHGGGICRVSETLKCVELFIEIILANSRCLDSAVRAAVVGHCAVAAVWMTWSLKHVEAVRYG